MDYVLAEFTILPGYRGNGFARKAINLLFEMFHGKWEIKYNIKNTKARNLWESATELYNPIKKYLTPEEPVLVFKN